MATQITFDAERIIGRLGILEKANFNYAGGQAMKRLGFGLRQHHGLQMAGRFADPVSFTLPPLATTPMASKSAST
jgi:hypothetical protein